eukprot:CAMPEP_0172779922 /NCGR_PEP_ID=MMETSP1074-20121228/202664_1 /TAXON_ID=2916 /ORGANISM="Ceratium fusus, Strain PA161109" /LENGTH=422 /DNA_ID=CAMNT_0013616891 /DNA_START=62 /DNA_END=1327 /DNA_ORIENTATION=+
MTPLWQMHVCALATCFLTPSMWVFVRGKSDQLLSPNMPARELDASVLEDNIGATSCHSHLQVRAKTSISDLAEHDLQDTAAATPLAQLLRPSLGGKPDVVEFAIFIKNFFGLQFRDNLFSMDVVLTLRWIDPRISKLLPAGANHTTVSLAAAKETIWLPDIIVANRAIAGEEEISSAIDLYRDGHVMKTQRIKLSVQQHFDVAAFPFDVQRPKIVLSSRTLMAQDLLMKEMTQKNFSGVKPGLFSSREFQFVSQETTVFEEADANLRKSRGALTITLQRDWTRYLQTTILPEIFLILISFTVFWMPRATPFAMPRVATNLISFLTLMTLSIHTAEMLPPDREGMAWIELFADSMQMQNCLILFLNLFVDWVYNTMGLTDLGEKMTRELAGLFPLMGIGVVIMCFQGRHGQNMEHSQTMIRLW